MPDTFFSFTHTEYADTASMDESITWIDYTDGIRTLFVATAPEFKPMLIEQCDINNHETIQSPKLSPSGRYLCYIKQTFLFDENNKKYLIVKDLHQQTVPSLTLFPGTHVHFNESRQQLLYIEECSPNKLTAVSLVEGSVEHLWSTQGMITSLDLCETRQTIALCCEKFPRSFIALYDLDKGKTEWVAPGFDIDTFPIWSPSGRHLAFIRYHKHHNDKKNALPGSASPAFSLMIFTCDTYLIQTLWDSRTAIITGQSTQEGQRSPCWLNDNILAFCHEGCGWEHAYHIDINNRKLTPLSKGDFLIRDLTVCQSSETTYLISNKYHRHHYCIEIIERNLAGSTNEPKTLKEQLSDAMFFLPMPVGNTCRYLALLRTSTRDACEITLLDRQSGKLLFPRKNAASKCSTPTHSSKILFARPSLHTLKTLDQKVCYGQVFKPMMPGQRPAILYLHDGPGQQSLPGFQPSLEMSFHYAFCQYMAARGFIVLDLNYRGSGGFNKSFREARNRGWHGASEYFDVLAAGKWLVSQSNVNTKQIGIMGKGWGGYLTALGLARDSQLFHAGVDIHGYHHFPRMMRALNQSINNKNHLFTCIEAESATRHIAFAKLATEYSPWDRLEDWMSPVLLVHGDNNTDVPFSEGQQLYHALIQQGVQVENLVIPGETHTFTYHTSWHKLAVTACQFFEKHLVN